MESKDKSKLPPEMDVTVAAKESPGLTADDSGDNSLSESTQEKMSQKDIFKQLTLHKGKDAAKILAPLEEPLYNACDSIDQMIESPDLDDEAKEDQNKAPDFCGPTPINWTREKALQFLGVSQYGGSLEHFVLDQSNQGLSNVAFMDGGIEVLAKEKWAVGYKDRLNKATFPDCYASEKYDAEQAPCKKEIIKYLFKCTWVEHGYTLLLVGGPGQGKTLLSVELGKAAVYQGYTTLFVSAIEFFHKLKKTEKTWGDLPRGPLFTVKLLIVDDIGHSRPSHPDEAAAFFRLIDWRVSKKLSTIFTSNTQPAEWVRSIGGPITTAQSSLDRVLYRSYYIKHKGTNSKRFEHFKMVNKDLRNRTK